MQIENINNSYFVKQNDTATEIQLRVLDGEGKPLPLIGKEVLIIIGGEVGRYLEKVAKVLPNEGELSFKLDEGDVLPSGKNWLEVHVINDDGSKVVAPSKGFYQLRVERSIDEMQAEVTTITLDYFTDRFNTLYITTESVKNSTEAVRLETESVKTATEAVKKATEAVKQDTEGVKNQALQTIAGWDYEGVYDVSKSYLKNNVVTLNGEAYIALKDVPSGQNPLNTEYWRIYVRSGMDGNSTATVYEDRFISLLDQRTFTLTNEYDQFRNQIEVWVGGVQQYSQKNFTESSPTSITFNVGVPLGVEVVVRYFSKALPLGTDIGLAVDNLTSQVSTVLTEMTSDIDGGVFGDTTTGVPVDGGEF